MTIGERPSPDNRALINLENRINILRIQERKSGAMRSEIGTLGLLYVEDGSRGLEGFAARYNMVSQDSPPIRDISVFFSQFTDSERAEVFGYYADMLLGTAVVEIEDVLFSGQLDIDRLYARFTNAASGKPYPHHELPNTRKVVLSNEDIQRMRALAAQDKTLTSYFYQGGIKTLPVELSMLLTFSPVFADVVLKLPQFRQNAQHLIQQRESWLR